MKKKKKNKKTVWVKMMIYTLTPRKGLHTHAHTKRRRNIKRGKSNKTGATHNLKREGEEGGVCVVTMRES